MQTRAWRITPEHSRWREFCNRLSGPEGCNFRDVIDANGNPTFTWNCAGGQDKTFAVEILKRMGYSNNFILASSEYFEAHGGYCDCEILFNVDPGEEEE